ncbi:HIRA-interacting protein 3 isoform X2 [Ixodes scapularis]
MAAVSASSMLEFVRRIFRERRDYGMLTIRQLRTLYTDELKVKHLSSENREVFASIVTTVFKEFENVVDCSNTDQDCDKLGRMDDVSEALEGDLYSPCSPSPPPQNGNCRPDDADSPFKGPASRNTQGAVVSSSDSDDDDVIRAVKETLGVRTHKPRSPQAQERKTPPRPLVFPTMELPCDASDSDSEGKLMIAESPVSAESPRRTSEDGEINSRLAEDQRDVSRVSADAAKTESVAQTPATKSVGNSGKNTGNSNNKRKFSRKNNGKSNSKAAGASNSNVGTKSKRGQKASPEDSNNSKGPKSVDDMPLFTLKFTKTKSGGWVMVRPRSEDSDAGDEATPRKRPPTRRRRVVAPKKAREKVTAKSIFDSSDDEPLSELRNRGATTAAPPVVRNSEGNADGNDGTNNTNTLSDLERKLEDVERRRSDGAPAKKRRKPASKPQSSEAPQVARLMRCIAAAGLRVSYVRLLEPTDSVQVKAAKLLDVLEKAGLKGKPTLKNCRKLKALQGLDEANVVDSLPEGRPKRTTRGSLGPLTDGVAPDISQESSMVADESRKVFSRLKDIIDSEEESE